MASGAQDTTAILGGAANGFATGGPVGAAIGVLAAIPTLFQTSLTGLEKEDATAIVNGVEPIFKENVTLFQQNPTYANQQQGITNFLSMWASLVKAITGQLGVQGGKVSTASINDRAPGGKFDWWKLYLDPIQNAKIQPAAQPVTDMQLNAPVSYWQGTPAAPPASTQQPSGANAVVNWIPPALTAWVPPPILGNGAAFLLLAAIGFIGYGAYKVYH